MTFLYSVHCFFMLIFSYIAYVYYSIYTDRRLKIKQYFYLDSQNRNHKVIYNFIVFILTLRSNWTLSEVITMWFSHVNCNRKIVRDGSWTWLQKLVHKFGYFLEKFNLETHYNIKTIVYRLSCDLKQYYVLTDAFNKNKK